MTWNRLRKRQFPGFRLYADCVAIPPDYSNLIQREGEAAVAKTKRPPLIC